MFSQLSSFTSSFPITNQTGANTYSNPSAISGTYGLLVLAPTLLIVALYIMGIVEIIRMYKALSKDISQPGLGTAANLLLAATVLFVISILIVIISLASGVYLLALVSVMLGLLVSVLVAAHFVMGYIATKKTTDPQLQGTTPASPAA